DGLVVRHQSRVDRSHVTAVHELCGRVARGRHTVVLTGAHQVDHLVRRPGHLDVDLAAGLLLERGDPVDALRRGTVLAVPGPADDVEVALAGSNRLLCLRAAASASTTTTPGDHQHGRGEPSDDAGGQPGGASSESAHFPSSSPFTATV